MGEVLDLAIIGAGPAGMAAAIYAKERKLNLLVFESNHQGGQLVSLYANKPISDYPGVPSVSGGELAKKISDHALSAGVQVKELEQVEKVVAEANNLFTITTNQSSYSARSVILATGMGSYVPRKLKVVGEDKYQNKGIYYQKLPQEARSKRIVVVGGGDTAVESAVQLTQQGAAVTVVHRGDAFTAQEKSVDNLKKLGVPIIYHSTVSKISGTDRLEMVEITDKAGNKKNISTDILVICIGVELDRTFLEKIGVMVTNQAVAVDDNMQTNISGLFACGDVVMPSGKYKRISIATGSAARAVDGSYRYLKSL